MSSLASLMNSPIGTAGAGRNERASSDEPWGYQTDEIRLRCATAPDGSFAGVLRPRE
jgi:hypothetical protein